jgi:hypothetical protein
LKILLVLNKEHVPGVKEELVPPAVQLASHDLVQMLLHHPDRKHIASPTKQCCGSRMFIPDPDFFSIPEPGSQNPDPTTAPKEEGGNFFCHTVFCSYKYHKIVNNFIIEQVKKIFLTKNTTFYPKVCH